MRRIGLVFVAAILAGCGSGSSGPSRAVTQLSLVVHSTEYEAGRSLVVTGESSVAEISTMTDQDCVFTSPCPISADVTLSSSAPAILSPGEQQVHTPATVTLVAHAPGTSTLTATVGGLTQSRRVDVVAEALPLDGIQVTLVAAWNDLPVEYDAGHSLTRVEVPAGEYGALEIVPLRGGAEVFGVPISVTTSAPNVAQGTSGCRPVRIDPTCDVYSDGWIWGVTPGEAQITVSGRNITTSFIAHVP